MSNGDYTDATVKSRIEADQTISPLALELARRIKRLPKFSDPEAIARIIDPYLKKWFPIATAPKSGEHILAADFRPGQVGFGGNPQQSHQCVVHWWQWCGGTHQEDWGWYPSMRAGEPSALTDLTHWKPLEELDIPPSRINPHLEEGSSKKHDTSSNTGMGSRDPLAMNLSWRSIKAAWRKLTSTHLQSPCSECATLRKERDDYLETCQRIQGDFERAKSALEAAEAQLSTLREALRSIEGLALGCIDTHATTCASMAAIQGIAEAALTSTPEAPATQK